MGSVDTRKSSCGTNSNPHSEAKRGRSFWTCGFRVLHSSQEIELLPFLSSPISIRQPTPPTAISPMTTMSDDGERACPLCTEEMDLTDQQLKPCKCGYEICVWCWHHIIEMADKDGSGGRCPACRTLYDKDRIVGMATKCERAVNECNNDKRLKSQKTKVKTSIDARKHLSSVRVIQRNLVYIIGLPSVVADESLLERKEYFGQYGRILKVSISRFTGGAQQPSTNSTFNVYITYSKEEEAVRCIQSVHNFVLEGRTLRACFGTTKYCHAWLRNMACSNPDCFYLHDVGMHEDSFTKDEVISAYTRSRVPQISSNTMQRRSGIMLPPPADDFCGSNTVSSAKIVVKCSSNNPTVHVKGSPPNGSKCTKSPILPAAASWGLRVSCSTPGSTPSVRAILKDKQEAPCSSYLYSTISSAKLSSAWHDDAGIEYTTKGIDKKLVDFKSKSVEASISVVDNEPKAATSTSLSDFAFTEQSSAWHDGDDAHALNNSLWSVKNPNSNDSIEHRVTSLNLCDTHITSAWDDDDDDNDYALGEIKTSERCEAIVGTGSPELPKSSIANNISKANTYSSADILLDEALSRRTNQNEIVSVPFELKSKVNIEEDNAQKDNSNVPDDAYLHSKSTGLPSGTISDGGVNGSMFITKDIQNQCSTSSSTKLDSSLEVDNHCEQQSSGLVSILNGPPRGTASRLFPSNTNLQFEHLQSLPSSRSFVVHEVTSASGETESNWRQITEKEILQSSGYTSGHLFDTTIGQRFKQPSGDPSTSTYLENSTRMVNNSSSIWGSGNGNNCSFTDCRSSDISTTGDLYTSNQSNILLPNRNYCSKFRGSSNIVGSCEFLNDVHMEEKGESSNKFSSEKNIISNILSMNFDPWSDSLNAANDFAMLLRGVNTQNVTLQKSSPCKFNNSNQSRFSFARQDYQEKYLEAASLETYAQTGYRASQMHVSDSHQNGVTSRRHDESTALISSDASAQLSDKVPFGSRSKVSAPPGFSSPNRAPPPGFSSQDRLSQIHDAAFADNQFCGNHVVQNNVHVPVTSDVEFVDPAILEVGKGTPSVEMQKDFSWRSYSSMQINPLETDLRLNLFMQQTVPAHQDRRISGHVGNKYLPFEDVYASSHIVEQNHSIFPPYPDISLQSSRNTQITNGPWSSWGDVQSRSDLGMPEVLRNDRLGLNMYRSGNEELNFHMPSGGNQYSQAFEM